MPKKKSQNSDRPLTAVEEKDIRLSIARGYKHLKLKPGRATAEDVQKAICAAIDAVCLGKKKATRRVIEDMGVNLGCLWGQSICDKLGWQWCFLTAHGDEGFAIVPPDRSYAIDPMSFVFTQLHKGPTEDNTSLLLFNMVVGGSFDKPKRGAYITVG
jgi:hypothetical protein